MARSIEEIKTEIKTKIRTFPSLNNFLFPEDGGSSVGRLNLIIDAVVISIKAFEEMLDLFKSDIEEIVNKGTPGSFKWVQDRILKFQFGDVITVIDLVPQYAIVNEANQIVKACSVSRSGDSRINIKVAKNSPLEPLSITELSAVQDYYFGTGSTEGISFAGVNANFISLEPDRLFIDAEVFYLGQFVETTVKTNVISAIQNFLQSFQNVNFDGTVFMIKLVDTIQLVEGVDRVVLNQIKGRQASVSFAIATEIDIQGFYNSSAGYLIGEDTSGSTLNDTITMTLSS